MKKITLALLLTLMVITNACKSDDDAPVTASPVTGSWKLTNVSGSITGASYNFEDTNILWTFNTNGTVTIVNNNSDENKEDFFDTGSYPYAFVPNEVTPQSCSESITVDNIDFGCYYSINGQLKFSQVETDGYVLTFQKQ